MTTTQAVQLKRHGAPEQLQIVNIPVPENLVPDEVRIKVAFCGVNFADILTRLGIYPGTPSPPFVPGLEISGRVEAVGENVPDLTVGQPVAAFLNQGGYTSLVQVKADTVLPLPDGISLDTAAVLPINYLTAWYMLMSQANIQPGETVLVHAAAGGVGLAALQICRWRNVRVVGTASSAKHERLYDSGITHCIDYRTQDFESEVMKFTQGRGVDVVLDAVGSSSFKKSYRCLAPLGRLIVFGSSSFVTSSRRNLLSIFSGLLNTPRFNPLRMIGDSRVVGGFHLGRLGEQPEKLKEAWSSVCGLMDEGHLDPVIDTIYPLAKAADAHHLLQSRQNYGKVLLQT